MSGFETLLHSGLANAGCEVARDVVLYWLADTFAHVGIASILSLFVLLRGWSLAWLWGGLALIVGKELGFDLPNDDWQVLSWLDSGWDLLSYLVGFFCVWWAVMADRTGAA